MTKSWLSLPFDTIKNYVEFSGNGGAEWKKLPFMGWTIHSINHLSYYFTAMP